MAELPILRWPDPRLSEPCAPVADAAAMGDLVRDMFETMYAAPGRGLAGPQVGVMQRIFVMDVGWKDGAMTPEVFINPRIVHHEAGLSVADEVCLSIPGLAVPVRRPNAVVLRWTGLDGAEIERRLDGAEARCAQHELDHLDGIVTLDRVAPDLRARLVQDFEAGR